MKKILLLFQIFPLHLKALSTEEPYLHICGKKSRFEEKTSGDHSIVNYDSIYQSLTNIEEGGLEICTGEFSVGLSGTYSISWSFSSSDGFSVPDMNIKKSTRYKDRGGGYSTYTTKLEKTASSQSRAFLKKGEVLQLNFYNRKQTKIENIFFCVDLVRAHEEKNGKKLNNPILKILPESQDNIHKISLSSDNLRKANRDLVQNVTEYFYLNHQDSSQVCDGKNSSRSCNYKICGTPSWCDAGCAFDYDTLGDCRDEPFGYGNKDGEKESVNPCFFLRFEAQNSWDPKPSRYYRKQDFMPEKHKDDQFQVGCTAKVSSSDIDYYAELVEMKKVAYPFSPGADDLMEYFIKEKDIFEDLVSLGENHITKFEELNQWWISPVSIDGVKIMNKLKNISLELFDPRDRYKKANFERLLNEYLVDNSDFWTVGEVVAFLKVMKSLDEIAAAKLYQDVRKVHNYAELFQLCQTVLGINNSYDDDEISGNQFCQLFYENEKDINRFLDILDLIEYLEDKDRIPDASSEADGIMIMAKFLPTEKGFGVFAEDKPLIEKLLKYNRDDTWKFTQVYNALKNEFIPGKNEVRVSHHPKTGGFPKKYFPMIGYEETPLVAIKLHLQEKKWLAPGQEVFVQCRAGYERMGRQEWYERMGEQTDPRKIEFKLKFL